MSLGTQLLWLVVLAAPIATISWTFTHEEVFREPREYCAKCSRRAGSLWQRKFFYFSPVSTASAITSLSSSS